MGELEVPGDGEAPVDSAPAGRPGFYAARLVYQQLQTISGQVLGIPAGGTILNTNTIYALVDIDAEGNYVQRTCGVEIRSQDADGSSGLFESDITPSPNIFPNIAPHTRKILWTEQGWELPMSGFPVGWEASDEAEAIPTSDSDARVRDTDQDGNPGITIVLSGNLFASGELYAVQRMRNRVVGRFDGDNLVGENFDQSEQEVLGGTIIDTQQTVADAGDSQTNRADLVLRPPDTLTCTQLLADPGAVFPAHPVY